MQPITYSKPPLCVDCAHYANDFCRHPAIATDVVRGATVNVHCVDTRYRGACGVEGKLFVAKQPAYPVPPSMDAAS